MRSWGGIARAPGLEALVERLDDALPLRLTLLVLLLRPPGEGAVRGATWLLAGAALAVPALARSAGLWLALALLVAARVVDEFPLADNHLYLLCYWCLGVGMVLALSASAPATRMPLLSETSRWLIACAFLCAVVWKGLLSPEFLDTRFFRVTLITDDRFAPLARAVGGLSDRDLARNRDALAPVPPDVEVLSGPTLVEPRALRWLAGVLTWGGFALECAVAVTFLCARPRWIARLRHPALLSFCVVTYAVAPVAGFGWLLAVLGMAHGEVGAMSDETTARGLHVAYAIVFVLVLIYAETSSVPWALDILGRDAGP